MNDRKICKRCGRELPVDMLGTGGWCKSCKTEYASVKKGLLTEKNRVKIKRMYKQPLQERILDTTTTAIKLTADDEVFVRLIDYNNTWVSNYGRIVELRGGIYALKSPKMDDNGDLICTIDKDTYDGNEWHYRPVKAQIWRLVTQAFIVNFDITNNTYCWHKNNNKADNYYKNIYPVNEKQYNELTRLYNDGRRITEKLILDICNEKAFKPDYWYAARWRYSLCGKGYSDGTIRSEADKAIYLKWVGMINRAYSERVHEQKPYYSDCTVDIEWHNFKNFRLWYIENAMGDKKLDLDKDILVQGNKMYGADTCTLVPHFINTVFEKNGCKTNIKFNEYTGKYEARISILGKTIDIGVFNTEEEARQAFIAYKQNYIKDIADKSKGKLPHKTYEAMKNWIVKIDS